MPIGIIMHFCTGAMLVYDAHECETEVAGMTPIRRRLSRYFERISLPLVQSFWVVSDSIADWYVHNYQIPKPLPIKNIPKKSDAEERKSVDLKAWLGIPVDQTLFIYQGSLGAERGIEQIIGAFVSISEKRQDLHVLFLGFGDMVEDIEELACHNKLVHYHPPVVPSELQRYTRGADVGIHLIQNTCLNHFMCLPNKVYEYVICGLPICVSDFPELSSLARQGCGWAVNPTTDALRDFLDAFDAKQIPIVARACAVVGRDMDWNTSEAPKIVGAYRRLAQLCLRVGG